MKEQRLLTIGMDAKNEYTSEKRLINEVSKSPNVEPQTPQESRQKARNITRSLEDLTGKIESLLEKDGTFVGDKDTLQKFLLNSVENDGQVSQEEAKNFVNQVRTSLQKTVIGEDPEFFLDFPDVLLSQKEVYRIAIGSGLISEEDWNKATETGKKAQAKEEAKCEDETTHDGADHGSTGWQQKAEKAFANWTDNPKTSEEIAKNQEIIKYMINLQSQVDRTAKEYSDAQVMSRPERSSSGWNSRNAYKGRREELKVKLRNLREEFRAYERIFQEKNPNPGNKYGKSLQTYRMETDANYREDFKKKDDRFAKRIIEADNTKKADTLAADQAFKRYQGNRKLYTMYADSRAKAERGFASIEGGGQFSVSGDAINNLPRYQVRGAAKKPDGSYDRNGTMDKVLGRMREGMRDEHDAGLERTAPRDIQRLFSSLPGEVQHYFKQPRGAALESKNGRIRVSANSNNDPMRMYEIYVIGGLGRNVNRSELDFRDTDDGNHALTLVKPDDVAKTLEKLDSLYTIGIKPAPEKKIVLPNKPIPLNNVKGETVGDPLSVSGTARTAVLFFGEGLGESVKFTKNSTTHKWKVQSGMDLLGKYGVRVMQKQEELSIEPTTKKGGKLELRYKTPEKESKTTGGGYEEAAVPTPKNESRAEASAAKTETPSEKQEKDARKIIFKIDAKRLRETTDRLDAVSPKPDSKEGRDAKAAIVEERKYLESYNYKQTFGEDSKSETAEAAGRLQELAKKYDKYKGPIDAVSEKMDLKEQKMELGEQKDFIEGAKELAKNTVRAIAEEKDADGTPEEVLEAIRKEKEFLEKQYPITFDKENTTYLESYRARLSELEEMTEKWQKRLGEKKPEVKKESDEPVPPPPPLGGKKPMAGEVKLDGKKPALPPKVEDKAEVGKNEPKQWPKELPVGDVPRTGEELAKANLYFWRLDEKTKLELFTRLPMKPDRLPPGTESLQQAWKKIQTDIADLLQLKDADQIRLKAGLIEKEQKALIEKNVESGISTDSAFALQIMTNNDKWTEPQRIAFTWYMNGCGLHVMKALEKIVNGEIKLKD